MRHSLRPVGQFEYAIARFGTLAQKLPDIARVNPQIAAHLQETVPGDFQIRDPVAELMSPECTPDQAREFALAWLRIAEGAGPDTEVEVVMDPEPVESASGPVVHYAPSRRPRRALRLRRR